MVIDAELSLHHPNAFNQLAGSIQGSFYSHPRQPIPIGWRFVPNPEAPTPKARG
jgi:hypothetical protein